MPIMKATNGWNEPNVLDLNHLIGKGLGASGAAGTTAPGRGRENAATRADGSLITIEDESSTNVSGLRPSRSIHWTWSSTFCLDQRSWKTLSVRYKRKRWLTRCFFSPAHFWRSRNDTKWR